MYLERCLVVTWLVPRGAAAVLGARSVYAIKLCSMSRHFMQCHIRRMHMCLTVTCHLLFLAKWPGLALLGEMAGPGHFAKICRWRDLLRATAVTRGCNGYRSKIQHRKLTLEKFIIPPLLPRLEPATFRWRAQRSNHWAILAPQYCCSCCSSHFFVFGCFRTRPDGDSH